MINQVTVSFLFAGDSVTYLKSGFQGIGTIGTASKSIITLRICGNSDFTSKATGSLTSCFALSNISHLLVENENGTQCNAKVRCEADSASSLTFVSSNGAAHSFVVNTTESVTFIKTGNKVSQNGLAINAGAYTFKVLSKVNVTHYGNGITFGSNVTITSVTCNHQFVFSECNVNFSGTIPSGLNTNDWVSA